MIKNKGESGKPLTNTPPLGYMKDPDDKNKWLIDERCAPTIREIFRLSVNHKYCYYRTAGNNNENLCSLLRSVSVNSWAYFSADNREKFSNSVSRLFTLRIRSSVPRSITIKNLCSLTRSVSVNS